MIILFFSIPIIFLLLALSYLMYFFMRKRNQKTSISETIWVESLDMNKWRGGVRRRMGLVKEKDEFYKIKKGIRFP